MNNGHHTNGTETMDTISYHALRRVDDRYEEILVTRTPGGSYKDMTEEHVAWHDDENEAKVSMGRANAALFASKGGTPC